MSQHLPVVSPRQAIQAFEKAGWMVIPGRGKGSHKVLSKPGIFALLTVPANNPVKRGTLRSLIRQAGLTVEQFRSLLS